MYIRYLRRKDGTPYGTVVALPLEDGGGAGFAICSKQDTFTKKQGRAIALARAKKLQRKITRYGFDFENAADSVVNVAYERVVRSAYGPEILNPKTRSDLAEALGAINRKRESVLETTEDSTTV